MNRVSIIMPLTKNQTKNKKITSNDNNEFLSVRSLNILPFVIRFHVDCGGYCSSDDGRLELRSGRRHVSVAKAFTSHFDSRSWIIWKLPLLWLFCVSIKKFNQRAHIDVFVSP